MFVLNAQLPPSLQQQQVNPLTLPGFSLPTSQNGLFRLSGRSGQGASAAQSGSVNAGDFSMAGRSVALGQREQRLGHSDVDGRSFSVVTQGGLTASAIAVSERRAGPGDGSLLLTGRAMDFAANDIPVRVALDGQALRGTAVAPAAERLGLSTVAPVPQRVTPVQGLPGNTAPSVSHKYLIETNPALTELKQFMSSDYLLGNLGFDPDKAQLRLGDGLYEQRLVREAVVARTGQRYLAGLTSDEAMYRYLMDNAIASKERLGLSLGVSLSAAQVAALTHDIVWLEEHEVLGEKVLVPVLYLAQAEGRLAANGALIQGRDVTLIAGNDLTNQGTLRASNNLSAVAGGSIVNSGLFEAGNRLDLLAEGSIRNAQGGIIAGRDVSLTALSGDVINERSVTRHEVNLGGRRDIQDFVDSAARIEAANRLDISAGRDIANLGGVLDSRGDLGLSAGRDVTLASVEERVSQARGNYYLDERVSQLGATVNAGRDINIVAGRDLTAIASRIEAGRDIALAAGNDVLIASAADESHYLSRSKRVTHQKDQVRQQASEIVAGGDVAISAANDLLLSASKVQAGDEAYLVAGQHLALLSAEDYDYSLYQKKKKGSFGRKSFRRDETTSVEHVGSEISGGGDVTLLSGSDQLYQAAQLESGGDLSLASGGAITFEGVKDLEQESHEKSKSSFAWQSAKGKGQTDETLRQSQLIAQGDIVIQAVEGLNIDIKHIDQKTVSQSIDAMVKADPQLAWLKEAEARGDVDWRRVKEIHDSFKYSSSGLGAGAQLVIAIVMAAVVGPAAMGALGAAGAGTAVAAGGAAVATGAATNAAISTINNRGDLGAVFKDVTSSDALKGYAISALTAGFTAGVLDSAFGVTGDNINKVTKGFDLGKVGGVAKFGAYLGTQGTVQALAQTALQGGSLGDNLQTALTGQVQHLLQAGVFHGVGDFADGQWVEGIKWADGSPEKIALHAVVGGLLSEATGGDFKTGALAGGANELLVEQLAGVIKGDKSLELTVSQLIGVAAATATGGDPAKAAELAKNATAYNRQLHPEEKALARRLAEQSEGRFTVEEIEDALRRSSIPGEGIYANTDMVVTADGIYDTGGQWIFGGDGQSFVQLLPEANVDAIRFVAENTSGYAWDDRSMGIQPDLQQMTYPLEFPGCIACAAGLPYSLNTLDTRTPTQMEADQRAFTLDVSSLVGLPISGGSLLATYGIRPILTGAGLGSGFDAVGQVVDGGEYRPGQTLVAGVTGGLAYPLAGGALVNALLGGVVGGTNTAVNNYIYAEDESIRRGLVLERLRGDLELLSAKAYLAWQLVSFLIVLVLL